MFGLFTKKKTEEKRPSIDAMSSLAGQPQQRVKPITMTQQTGISSKDLRSLTNIERLSLQLKASPEQPTSRNDLRDYRVGMIKSTSDINEAGERAKALAHPSQITTKEIAKRVADRKAAEARAEAEAATNPIEADPIKTEEPPLVFDGKWAFGSYNLSFVIEKGKFVANASDNTFHQRQLDMRRINPTTNFFKNEVDQIDRFITWKYFAAIGFQEVSIYKKSDQIYNNVLTELGVLPDLQKSDGNVNFNGKFLSYAQGKIGKWSKDVNGSDSSQGALMIWDPEKLGEFVKDDYKDFDGLQEDRPIQMVLTKKDFLLINFHAPNFHDPSSYGVNNKGNPQGVGADYLTKTFEKLFETINIFLGGKQIIPQRIIFMTDLNDHRNFMMGFDVKDHPNKILKEHGKYTQGITFNQGITFKDDQMYGYNGHAPLSCCYSYTSSCADKDFVDGPSGEPFDVTPNTDRKECKKLKKTIPLLSSNDTENMVVYNESKTGLRWALSNERGAIKNYRHQSDFVLAHKDVCGPIKTYNNYDKEFGSVRSDHEMVFMMIKDPTKIAQGTKFGGRRTRRKRRTRRLPKRSYKV